MTVIEELLKVIEGHGLLNTGNQYWIDKETQMLDQLKAKHKEDVINHVQNYILWHRKQDNISDPYDEIKSRKEAEQYYNETFKQ